MRLVEKAQGLQRLDGVEPAVSPLWRRRWQRLHELAVGAGRGGLAEHDEKVAVGARHGHHVASGAHGAPLWLFCSDRSSGGVAVDDDDVRQGCRDVELQVHALLLGPDPTLLQGLPVQADDKLMEYYQGFGQYCARIFCKHCM